MSYKLFILRRAQKELSKLPEDIYEKIKQEIFKLSQNPKPIGAKKLINREGWRIKIGNHRIIYEIDKDNQTITILHIGHRKDVYR